MNKTNNRNPPCIISFTSWDEKMSIELDHSDIDMEQFYDLCRRLAGAAGFSPSTIKEYFE